MIVRTCAATYSICFRTSAAARRFSGFRPPVVVADDDDISAIEKLIVFRAPLGGGARHCGSGVFTCSEPHDDVPVVSFVEGDPERLSSR